MPDPQYKGFPNSQQVNYQAAPTKTKNRLFLGILLIAGCLYIGYHIWNAFCRYHAYGIVNGRTIEISSSCDGSIVSVFAKRGDQVTQGQLIAVVENLELRHKYESARDDLALASSRLEAQLSKLKLEYAFLLDGSNGLFVKYYEALSNLAEDEGKMEVLRDQVIRAENVGRAISAQEVAVLRAAYEGQKNKVIKLRENVKNYKTRIEKLESSYEKKELLSNWEEQLKPFRLEIEKAIADLQRASDKLTLTKIVSPVNGVILNRFKTTGEQTNPTAPIFLMIEDGTLFVELYVQQDNTDMFNLGENVLLHSPVGDIQCIVKTIADRYETAPNSIKRFYKADENLLPVILELDDNYGLKYGATVKLPYKWSW